MREQNKKWEIQKNIVDLEYKKLLQEYNAWLIALISVTLGLLGFIYNSTKDISIALFWSVITVIVLNSKRENKSGELKNKIEEIKNIK